MKNMLNWKTLGVCVSGSSGFVVAGCKSAPELTPAQALALIQAKYDQTAPVGTNIMVNDVGMRPGITAKYWDRTKVYPNKILGRFQADAGREEGGEASRRRRRDRVASGEPG